MLERLKKRAVENVKGTIKEEALQCMDDIIPTLLGFASLGLFILCNIPSAKPVSQTITINNYYYLRRN